MKKKKTIMAMVVAGLALLLTQPLQAMSLKQRATAIGSSPYLPLAAGGLLCLSCATITVGRALGFDSTNKKNKAPRAELLAPASSAKKPEEPSLVTVWLAGTGLALLVGALTYLGQKACGVR